MRLCKVLVSLKLDIKKDHWLLKHELSIWDLTLSYHGLRIKWNEFLKKINRSDFQPNNQFSIDILYKFQFVFRNLYDSNYNNSQSICLLKCALKYLNLFYVNCFKSLSLTNIFEFPGIIMHPCYARSFINYTFQSL